MLVRPNASGHLVVDKADYSKQFATSNINSGVFWHEFSPSLREVCGITRLAKIRRDQRFEQPRSPVKISAVLKGVGYRAKPQEEMAFSNLWSGRFDALQTKR